MSDIEEHFHVREKERANEVKAAIESVYHHQHSADAQRLLRYREYVRECVFECYYCNEKHSFFHPTPPLL